MNDLIAKRYVKALLDGKDVAAATSIYNELSEISKAFADDKFISIISSIEVKESQKADLIISLIDNTSDTTKNLIKLLGSKKRLELIPFIVAELKAKIGAMGNSYEGVVYTNNALSEQYINSIAEQFSKKFDVKLSLTQDVCDYDGIKVDIDGLGVEISFSKDRLKSQMINHILKAV
ncbi:MAG: F0F1 ATP synthase subunit delta [Arcobacter sp.]|uniref:F0F1 ATP synthase subunit delta n=1 Tax=uncultured Arcobacter sp. TaxID=165434 RepID=UPI000CC7BEFA|nr:F0F1 ATP synthase subunit delta [uncultured Arcobacter sp.]PLY10284.1 MAG: F0F1 ATP synthase subunit delta [Arcobacter sp.]